MVTNFDYLAEKLPLLDLTNLKVSAVAMLISSKKR